MAADYQPSSPTPKRQETTLPPTQSEKTPLGDDGPSEGTSDGDEDEDGPGLRGYMRIFTLLTATDAVLNVLGGLAAIGAGATLPLMALVFGSFVGKFTDFGAGETTPEAFRADVNSFTLWFVYLFIGKFTLTYLSGAIFTFTALRVTKTLRSEFVKAVLRQEISFYDKFGPGAVAVKATTNADLVNAGISEKLARVIQSISMMVTALVIALVQSWQMTLIIIAVVSPLFVILGITMTIEANVDSRILKVYANAANLAEEIIGSIKTVHAFGASRPLLARFDKWLVQASHVGSKKGPTLGIMYGSEFFFSFAPYAMAFWQGTRMYLSGQVESVGTLVIVIFAVLMISNAIGQIAPATSAFIQAASASSELFEILDRKSQLDPHSTDGAKPDTVTGHISIRNVEFAYPSRPDIQVLKGVSIDVPAKKTTAFVGASGSGKSTIISLLERWYEPGNGFLTLDGHRIDELNVKWLRSKVRLVQQEPVLFNDTIFNNVAQGLVGTVHEHADERTRRDMVAKACRDANAADFIETLPNGYDTNVGERAGLLSGGQKQRIAIARSIISDPPVLLLDEATSALDANSEKVVQQALDKVSMSRTTIVIAHKLTTIMKADNIIVLGHGEVLEQGTHQSLLQRDGPYAALVNAQSLGDNSDDSAPTKDEREALLETTQDDSALKMESTAAADMNNSPLSADAALDPPRSYSLFRILVIFLGENLNLWHMYLVCIIAALIGGAVYPVQAILLTRLITAYELPDGEIQAEVNLYALMFFIVAIVMLIAYTCLGWVTNTISQILTRRYRFELLESIVRQDITFFDQPENNAATLTSRLSTDPTGLQELVGINLALMLVVIINLTSSVVLALVYGWKLGLVVFSTLPLIFGSGFLRLRLESKFEAENASIFADSARFASQAVGAMRTVSAFTLEHNTWAEYDMRLQGSLRNPLRVVGMSMVWYALAESVEFLVMALAFWYGGKLLADGEYTTEQFFVIYIAIVFGGEAAGQFFAYTPNITKAHAGGNYILKLRESKASITDTPDGHDPDPGADFHFDHVHFRYPQRQHVPVLQGLQLDIKAGSSVAFVGGSGCGKSTTIGLLERYYDPTHGQIRLGNESISQLQVSAYRNRISLVSQEPTLYQGTIKDNIVLGATSAVSDEQIETASKDANILTFIQSLPSGFHTECGSRGTQLSGGQKQRIAIARAMIRDPSIILLDEATSALDTTSEKVKSSGERAGCQRCISTQSYCVYEESHVGKVAGIRARRQPVQGAQKRRQGTSRPGSSGLAESNHDEIVAWPNTWRMPSSDADTINASFPIDAKSTDDAQNEPLGNNHFDISFLESESYAALQTYPGISTTSSETAVNTHCIQEGCQFINFLEAYIGSGMSDFNFILGIMLPVINQLSSLITLQEPFRNPAMPHALHDYYAKSELSATSSATSPQISASGDLTFDVEEQELLRSQTLHKEVHQVLEVLAKPKTLSVLGPGPSDGNGIDMEQGKARIDCYPDLENRSRDILARLPSI
ncbi:ABC multidrug transporter MDR5 [Paramyrothecium foliicola]|nr:ABC multidrug transporter MDR5 [Paramyrothecium foliicola]